MKLGIIGGGVVGQATARAFLEHVDEVRVYDIAKEKCTHSQEQVVECDVVMVCLPTPQREGSLECNTGYVEEFFCWAASFHGKVNYVLRSTVPVGFTRKMVETYGLINLVHSPEFLTARCSMVDAQIPSRNVIGWPIPNGLWCKGVLADLYKNRWPHIPLIYCDSNTSEAAKVMQNSFFAVKVGMWNEMYMFSEAAGADWEIARSIILLDGRINDSHTRAPGPDGKFGWGGSCLPKDLASFIHQAQELGGEDLAPYMCAITKSAYERNKIDRERDPKRD